MRGTTPQTISSWVSIWRPASTRSSSRCAGLPSHELQSSPLPSGAANSWSAARPRPPRRSGTVRGHRARVGGGRRLPGAARASVLRGQSAGDVPGRPGRWVETSEISRTRSSAQASHGSRHPVANYMRYGGREYHRLRREPHDSLVHQLYGVFPELVRVAHGHGSGMPRGVEGGLASSTAAPRCTGADGGSRLGGIRPPCGK